VKITRVGFRQIPIDSTFIFLLLYRFATAFSKPGLWMTTSKWARLTKSSQDTATRDIIDLIKKGILERSAEGGRSTSYNLLLG
jgi:hypothetical protein